MRGDVLEQRVLGGPGQICQQTLGEPGSGFSGVEARRPQGRDPVIPKVHGDLAPLGQRYRVLFAQHVILEFEDFRLIELVHDGAVGPGQPVDPGIQAGGQDHYLLDAGTCCSREEFVEILGTHGEMVDQVDGGGVPLGLGRARGQRLGETRFAGGLNEGTGVLVADQRFGPGGLKRPERGHHQGRETDAADNVPLIAVGPCHVPASYLGVIT
ncbi:Uncharacterised protein [Mycobacteroides abscessus subsp. abscessus]|nr:Uncharacterised protein [Mycobacteroides abscessus subsp. abscessus]